MNIPSSLEIRVRANKKINIEGHSLISLSPYAKITAPATTHLKLPKSGRFFVEKLKQADFEEKDILDIGTGFWGYLARHAVSFGARKVVASDINKAAIKHVKKECHSEKIDFRVGNVYSALQNNEKFNIIISNPPQLPSLRKCRPHDYGGRTGLDVIRRILSGFPKFSKKSGVLYLLAYDFLYEKISALCRQNGLSFRIIGFYKKQIRKGGETEKEIEYIKKLYPNYNFILTKNELFHNFLILKIKK